MPPSLLARAMRSSNRRSLDATAHGSFWHLSAVRGTASSRQLLEVERTYRRHRRTDAIDPQQT
jgi:hypothetical protein